MEQTLKLDKDRSRLVNTTLQVTAVNKHSMWPCSKVLSLWGLPHSANTTVTELPVVNAVCFQDCDKYLALHEAWKVESQKECFFSSSKKFVPVIQAQSWEIETYNTFGSDCGSTEVLTKNVHSERIWVLTSWRKFGCSWTVFSWVGHLNMLEEAPRLSFHRWEFFTSKLFR